MKWPVSDRVIVAGSGPSIAALTQDDILSSGAVVIAVNGAIDWLGAADYWFTLDPSQVNLVRARNRAIGCRYVMAVPDYFPVPSGVTRLRRIEGRLYGRAKSPGGFADEPDAINTGNSGFGAMNLAYHMRPSKVLMLGVDGKEVRRVDGGMPRTLAHLPDLFASALPQLYKSGIEVVNGSPDSAVNCFRRMEQKEGIAWLKS